MTKTEAKLWIKVYVAEISNGTTASTAAEMADIAVKALRGSMDYFETL